MTKAARTAITRMPIAAMSCEAKCAAYADAAPIAKTRTNINKGNELFLFIYFAS
jgi:hypothetical protein